MTCLIAAHVFGGAVLELSMKNAIIHIYYRINYFLIKFVYCLKRLFKLFLWELFMNLKKISLALLLTANLGVLKLAAEVVAPSNANVLMNRVANEGQEVKVINEGAQAALEQRLAAAKQKYNELSAVVEEKTNKVQQSSDELSVAISLAHKRTNQILKATEELDQAKAQLEGSEAYFLLTKLDPKDRADLVKLYADSLQITDAKTRAVGNINTMSGNVEKFKTELDAKRLELDKLNAEILAAATAEYTPPISEVKQEELSAKQAVLAAAQAKQAELSVVTNNLSAKINSAAEELKRLESRLPAAKAAKSVDNGAALQVIIAKQKIIKTQKLTDEQELSEANLQSDLAAKQVAQLQDVIGVLQADIAAIPAATPNTDIAAGESMVDKLKRLPVLKARITKLEASQDSKGKLQISLAKMQESLKELEAQGAAKDAEIRAFKDKLVEKQTAGKVAAAIQLSSPVSVVAAIKPSAPLHNMVKDQ